MDYANQSKDDVVRVIETGINGCILPVSGKRVLRKGKVIRAKTQEVRLQLNADYTPTDSPKLLRLIKCLKSS